MLRRTVLIVSVAVACAGGECAWFIAPILIEALDADGNVIESIP